MHYRPIGVVGAITPWNWPLIIATWQIAPSLRMGNTVVQKPSEYTTLCALALVEVLNEVLPDGVLTAVTGAGEVAEGLFWGAFINNGQTCAALKRLYVPDGIYDQVIDALTAFTGTMPTGPGL